jgi:hypothetical protein
VSSERMNSAGTPIAISSFKVEALDPGSHDLIKSVSVGAGANGNYSLRDLAIGPKYILKFSATAPGPRAYHDEYHEGTHHVQDARPVCIPAPSSPGGNSTLIVNASLVGITTPTTTQRPPTPTSIPVHVDVSSDCAIIHRHPMGTGPDSICWAPLNPTPVKTATGDLEPPPQNTPVVPQPEPSCVVDIRVALPACAESGTAPQDVTIRWPDRISTTSVTMTLVSEPEHTFDGALPAVRSDVPLVATLHLSWKCGNSTVEGVSQSILVGTCDPSGMIGIESVAPGFPTQPIQGAEVLLYVRQGNPDELNRGTVTPHDCRLVESRHATPVPTVTPVRWGRWSGEDPVVPSGESTASPAEIPNQNATVTTNSNGQYGWLAAKDKCYYVRVIPPTSTPVNPQAPTPTGTPKPPCTISYSPLIGERANAIAVNDLSATYRACRFMPQYQ